MKTKVCSKCGERKKMAKFTNQKDKGDGKKSHCKECVKIDSKEYRSRPEVKERHREYQRNLRYKKYNSDENFRKKALESAKRFGRSERGKELQRKRQRRYRKNIRFKLRARVSIMVCDRLKARSSNKNNKSTFNGISPYTLEELMIHLEKKFEQGMSWDNYGKWQVDHIIPDSWFTYSSIYDEGFQKCWALSNLQPMWKSENCSKNNRYAGKFKGK